MTKPRRRKAQQYIKLGEISEQFEGWIIDRHGLKSPEGELFKESDLRFYHWQGQILSVLRYRINRPEQYSLF